VDYLPIPSGNEVPIHLNSLHAVLFVKFHLARERWGQLYNMISVHLEELVLSADMCACAVESRKLMFMYILELYFAPFEYEAQISHRAYKQVIKANFLNCKVILVYEMQI